ncbi:hypothetical protein H3Z85_00980 [Chryseobacterium indologenes]|uniref:ParB/Sulfiredoxin domain-containing protein n=2 Tax=Chryseobacterium TaxID=59732 RepID=A0A3G6RSZ7_CHRLC|nr:MULTISPECIES: hypothetical protein [Bacteroidota]AZA84608.1 hypothetical protein EG342_23120 [Chryseobacterium lactis]AZB04996.1 hypothetical protein EG341_14000 [Chryseobacterium lactis]MBF6643587.1 hypothetical protein [Chryseobacterium indologenes]PNW14727.1 hypothetical protein C1637_07150 [Chryseobacterium lactis]QPQ52124.1 hypothetical protein H3Z85_00980 [Chryseobacterium indologenes]
MPYKYSDEQRIEWLRSLNPKFDDQNWHDDVVVHFSHIKNFDFFISAGTFREKIDPSKICGIDYSYGYNCVMYKPKDWRYYWLQFFTDLRRLDRVIDNFPTKETVIEHIHNAKEAKTVVQYGNHYFTIGGQHRLCLAKFLEVPEIEVDVIKYVFDRVHFAHEMRFQRTIPALQELGFLSLDYHSDLHYDFFIIEFAGEYVSVKKRYAHYILKRYTTLKKMPLKGFLNYVKAMDANYYDKKRIDEDVKLYILDAYLLKHLKTRKKLIDVYVNNQ